MDYLGGGGGRVCWPPPSQIIGGGGGLAPPGPPLPTPMVSVAGKIIHVACFLSAH